MDNILNFPDRKKIQEEAGFWLVKLDSGQLSKEDAEAFRAWLDTSPEHRHAVIELTRLWDNMGILAELSDLFPLPHKCTADSKRSRWLFYSPVVSLVAVFAFVALMLTFVMQQYPTWLEWNSKGVEQAKSMYQTSIGEQTDILLPDGSDTKLNTDSFLEVAYSEKQRNVRLIKGEAHFQVAHDTSRPFVVHAGNGIIRAVGTAFSVRLKGEDVEVMVTEGRVEIAASVATRADSFIDLDDISSRKPMTTLEAGQNAEYGNDSIHMVQNVKPEIIERKMSWQHGMLKFEGETLAEVIEEISRYSTTEIIISDPKIRDIRIGGYFRVGEIDALLVTLENSFSINVVRINDNLIYLNGTKVTQAATD